MTFIAAAREDVPWLVSEVERLTAERDALAAQVARVEALAVLSDWYGDDEYREQCAEVRREGFDPDRLGPAAFVYRYFVKAQGMKADGEVTRIEWRYLDTEAGESQ
jgi:hypothetical protein